MPEQSTDGSTVLSAQGLPFTLVGVGDLLALFRCVSVRYRFSTDVMKPSLMGAIGRVLVELYCNNVQMPPPKEDSPGFTTQVPLDVEQRQEQLSPFIYAVYEAAAAVGLVGRAVPDDADAPEVSSGDDPSEDEDMQPKMQKKTKLPRVPRTTNFWRELNRGPASRASIKEWIKLAHISLVQVHGSVEDPRGPDEGMFSALTYLMNKYRNRLQEEPLNVAARFFKLSCFMLSDFPYDEALEIWHARDEKRGRYSKP